MKPKTDILKAVEAELARRKWSRYDLVQAVAGHGVAADTVYKFLAGTRGITDKYLSPILRVLDLTILPISKPGNNRRK